MDPFRPRNTKLGPEALRQKRVMTKLRANGWHCKETHGNEFQSGFPDIFACHLRYGSRWVEIKCPTGSRLEESQIETFTEFGKKRIGVWVLTDDTEYELNKLMIPGGNWYQYLNVFKVVTRDRAKAEKEKARARLASTGPERIIQEALKNELARQNWYVKETHGNIFSYGFPDLYACHREYGARWIEVKRPTGSTFTPAQLETFPLFQAHGCGVWVLTGVHEIPKLMKAANWWQMLDAYRS